MLFCLRRQLITIYTMLNILDKDEIKKYINDIILKGEQFVSSEHWCKKDKNIVKLAITLPILFDKIDEYAKNNNIPANMNRLLRTHSDIYAFKVEQDTCEIEKMYDGTIFIQKNNKQDTKKIINFDTFIKDVSF